MSSHDFHKIYLHINRHAKNNHPLLTAKREPLVHDFVRQRCRQRPSADWNKLAMMMACRWRAPEGLYKPAKAV